jgi:hypothetical protein
MKAQSMRTILKSTRGQVVQCRWAEGQGPGEPRMLMVEPVDQKGPAPSIAVTPGFVVEVCASLGDCDVLTSAREMRRVAGILLGAAEFVEDLESGKA